MSEVEGLSLQNIIFVDFESVGQSNEESSPLPVMVGFLSNGSVPRQIVLNAEFLKITQSLTNHVLFSNVDYLPYENLGGFLENLAIEHCVIAAWSENEFDYLSKFPELSAERWSYLNVRKLAKR